MVEIKNAQIYTVGGEMAYEMPCKMVTIFQVRDFLSQKELPRAKYIGSFFSLESAEQKLGWFFVNSVCVVQPF